jgi:hypothetical protein
MDAQDRQIYSNLVNVTIQMTSAANKLAQAVDELTTAVVTLTAAVAHQQERADHAPAE